MKVLVLNFEKTWRGGERQTLYNMQGFREEGVDVVLACRSNTPLAVKAKEQQFEVCHYDSVFGIISLLLSKGSSFDVIHVQTSHMLTYAAYTKPFHGTKIVFTRRVNFQPKGFFTKLKYQLSDRVVAISQSVKRVLHNFGIREVSVVSDIVVGNTLDKERANAEMEESINRKAIVVATMAALSKDKDPLTMVKAIKALSEKRQDFVFLHFGSGDMVEDVKQKIEEYNLLSFYKLVGFHEKVEDYFSLINVFVMSSEQEGLGSIVLDAFNNKVPVVATKAGGMAELVDKNRGIACDIKDAKALGEGIDAFLSDSVLANETVNNAYEYVNDNHSSKKITAMYMDIFKKL